MKAKNAIKPTLIFLNTILSQIVSPVTIPLERFTKECQSANE